MNAVAPERFVLRRGPQTEVGVRQGTPSLSSRLSAFSPSPVIRSVPLRSRTVLPEVDLGPLVTSFIDQSPAVAASEAAVSDVDFGGDRRHDVFAPVVRTNPATTPASDLSSILQPGMLVDVARPLPPLSETSPHAGAVASIEGNATTISKPVPMQPVTAKPSHPDEAVGQNANSMRSDLQLNEFAASGEFHRIPRTLEQVADSGLDRGRFDERSREPQLPLKVSPVQESVRHPAESRTQSQVSTLEALPVVERLREVEKNIVRDVSSPYRETPASVESMGELHLHRDIAAPAFQPHASNGNGSIERLAQLEQIVPERDSVRIGTVQVVVRANTPRPAVAAPAVIAPSAASTAVRPPVPFRNIWLSRRRYE